MSRNIIITIATLFLFVSFSLAMAQTSTLSQRNNSLESLKTLAQVSSLNPGQNTRQNTFRDESDRRKLLSHHSLGSKSGNKYYSADQASRISSKAYPSHNVQTHSEKDKDGNEIITETHTYTDTETLVHHLKPGEKAPEHKGPQVKRTKTADGWIEETTSYETVVVPQEVIQEVTQEAWSKTQKGKGWNKFKNKKKKKRSKSSIDIKKQLRGKKSSKKNRRSYKSQVTYSEDTPTNRVESDHSNTQVVRVLNGDPKLAADYNQNMAFGN